MANGISDERTYAPPRLTLLARALSAAFFFAAALLAQAGVALAQATPPGSPDLVISQVYTRGGEPGATYRNDFVEIFNRGDKTVNLADYSIFVLANVPPSFGLPGGLSPHGTAFFVLGSSVPLQPGRHMLIQFGSSGSDGAALPVTPDLVLGSSSFNADLPGDAGRVAIVVGSVDVLRYGCHVGTDAALVDFFSYGATTCAEGPAVFTAPAATAAAVRNGDGCTDTDNNVPDFSAAAPNPRNSQTAAHPCNLPVTVNGIQFESATATVGEFAGSVEVFVTRFGEVSGPASVQYATSDDFSSDRTDYTTAFGTVNFAAGETRKSFRVLITDETRPESGPEGFYLSLNYPIGGGLGAQHVMKVDITDDDATAGANPINTTDFFVAQHYRDFLSRTPDPAGFQFWTGEIENCGADLQCREVKRINVSAAFFLSVEFQETGYFAYLAHKASFPDSGSRPFGFPTYRELWRDAQHLGRGVVVNQGDWEGRLTANKQAYVAEFVTRPEFLIRYPATQTPAEFVDLLNATAGNPLSQAERDQQFAELTAEGNSSAGRARVLRRVIDDADFRQAEFSRAFVLMQYFGYLRRNPHNQPDTDFAGYNFWLGKLNQFGGNFIEAEMVKAFITSTEYRHRFAQ